MISSLTRSRICYVQTATLLDFPAYRFGLYPSSFLAKTRADHDEPARDPDAGGEAGAVVVRDPSTEPRQRVEGREAGADGALSVLN